MPTYRVLESDTPDGIAREINTHATSYELVSFTVAPFDTGLRYFAVMKLKSGPSPRHAA